MVRVVNVVLSIQGNGLLGAIHSTFCLGIEVRREYYIMLSKRES